jgi:hypothetical protein
MVAAMMGTPECDVIQEFLGIEAPCGNPAIGRFTRICVHEHLREGWLCAYHAENSERGLCRDCDQLPGVLSHDCPIAVAAVAS